MHTTHADKPIHRLKSCMFVSTLTKTKSISSPHVFHLVCFQKNLPKRTDSFVVTKILILIRPYQCHYAMETEENPPAA
jgi:hypothetical protein